MRKICLMIPLLALFAGCQGIPPKPSVQGEVSSGHYRPSWSWKPGGNIPATTQYRHRLDGESWTYTTKTLFTPKEDLTKGEHLFEIQAAGVEGLWSPTTSFTTTIEFFDQKGYWKGVERTLLETQLGKKVLLSAHNSYEEHLDTPQKNLAKTLQIIHAAQADKADAIELDIVSWDNILRVTHDDNCNAEKAARLSDVLADQDLREGNQLLYLELKEKKPNKKKIRLLLDLLVEHQYATNGRPVVLRSFATDKRKKNLSLLKTILQEPAYIHIRPYIRMHALVGDKGSQKLIGELYDDGIDAVEIKYSRENLFGMLVYAKALGMGTGVWSLGKKEEVSAFREVVDTMILDLATDKARDLIVKPNSLLFLNVWNEEVQDGKIGYQKEGEESSTSTAAAGFPKFEWVGLGEDRFGGSLVFQEKKNHAISFGDLENESGKGILLSLVVNFDDLSVKDGETSCLVAKTDQSGFGLELHNPEGWFSPTVLRFAVHVNGQYRYATRVVSDLNQTDSYHILAAYNGSGKIQLWVNGRQNKVSSQSAFGGMTKNNSPLLLGADPQGNFNRRFFFSGKIQQLHVQRW